jgi:hypothetical protein
MDNAFWQAILDADGAVPEGYSVAQLTPELLALLGSTDPFLRDGVAYTTLATWLKRGHYAPAEVWNMAERLAANLLARLGEQSDDSVFLRSFSALMLAEIVYRDNKSLFLDERQVQYLLEQTLVYVLAEQDLRGYVPGKGWAHAVAHTADVLWVLAGSRHIGASDLGRMLDIIAARAAPPGDHIYLYNEDQRLARAAATALRRDLLELPFLVGWVERIVRPGGRAIGVESFYDGQPPAVADAADLALLRNTTQFLRGLYFQLAHSDDAPAVVSELLPLVVEALRPMNAC